MISRRTETPEIKQWKQDNRVMTRKLEDSQKTILKLLSTFVTANPDHAIIAGKLLSNHDASAAKLRKQENLVHGKLKKINEGVTELKQALKYFDKTNQSLLKVQKLSEGIFEKMESMKTDMAVSYDQLDELQQKYSADLELYERRIEGGFEGEDTQYPPHQIKNKENFQRNNKQRPKTNIQPTQQPQSKQPNSQIQTIELKMKSKQQEVENIDNEIRQLGKNLGWHEEDHRDFITIWNRCHPHKNYFEIEDELVEYFKLYTNEQIQDHMNKYTKLKKLQEKKKDFIAEYKSLKQLKRAEEVAILQSNEYETQKKIKREEDLRRAEQEQKEMKQKVQMWKKKKQQEKIEEKRREEQQKQIKKRQQLERKREEEQRRRQVLQKWRQEKQESKQQASVRQSARRPHSAVNKQTRERIKQREEQIIKQKMQRAIQKRMEREELQQKAEKIKQQKLLKYAHVGSKLEEKTTAIKQKQRQKFDGKEKKEAHTFGGQLLMTGIRAVPQWRQGL